MGSKHNSLQAVRDAVGGNSTALATARAQVLATCAVAEAIEHVAIALIRLGNNDAATEMGAIESLGLAIKNSLDGVASAVGGLG